ncbi:hypothetical protein GCM10009714_30530 [Microlunatus capsulatus]
MARDLIADDGMLLALADGAPPSVDDDALASALVTAVLATPGVVRLEPTLQAALRRLRRDRGAGAGPPGELRLTRRGDVVDVGVDLVTAPDAQARRTAEAVRERLRSQLAASGLRVGALSVSVLSIEAGAVLPAGAVLT